jgi:hypothetical protein
MLHAVSQLRVCISFVRYQLERVRTAGWLQFVRQYKPARFYSKVATYSAVFKPFCSYQTEHKIRPELDSKLSPWQRFSDGGESPLNV